MEIQKFRILRTNPDINWTIPCSGATDLWPLNTSNNCTGTTIYDSTLSEVMGFINSNSDFPDKLKDCSITNPGVIVDDSSYTTDPAFCSNIGGHKYILFKGLSLNYNANPIQGSYNELSSVLEGYHEGTNTSLLPNVIACTCNNPLGTYINKLPVFLSQDYNDIGHYDIWDGNIGQQDTFGNFILSATSSSGYQVTVYRTTDIAYHAGVKTSIFTIDWGDNTTTAYGAASYQETHTYNPGLQKQYRVIVTQDTPWGSKSVSNIVTIPHFTYPVMFNHPYSPPTSTGPGSGMTANQNSLTGLGTSANPSGGASSAYHSIYGVLGERSYMPLDSATDIDQFSAMTYGINSADGAPCYTVSGITDSMLDNFQTYTTASTVNLPPGYQAGVLVPIGGDVVNPITNTFETGVYGSIIYATPSVTAYTISSSYGASGGYANGDTPINLWDFSNGITIFEAESCGLDKRTFGALECIDCPDDDCMWCQYKDEYIDRTNNTAYEIPVTNVMGLWNSTLQYSFGDIVYDITWNACCCYVNVGGNPATVIGISPSSMQEGVWNGIHMWEGCSDECVSCPIGTQSPCNDTSIAHAYPDATSIPSGKASYYNPGNNYSPGDYAKGGNGNCYKALNGPGTLAQPTGSTVDWDYVGCVSWDCPTDLAASDCVMISGFTNTSTTTYGDCNQNFINDDCFLGQWICDSYFQCGGCHEIFPGDASGLYNDPIYSHASDVDCLATCSPPAWSCETPTDINCCVSFNCANNQVAYIDNVWQTYNTYGSDPAVLSGHGLFFGANDCTSNCCVFSSFTWTCEQGCISQNDPGGYDTFNECWTASYTDTSLNPHIGEINPDTGVLYTSDGTGTYNATTNNIPCGWSCGTITEIYNPGNPGPDGTWGTGDDVDPLGFGQYLSPCDPCFENGCGVATMQEDCVSLCSAATNCYICDCLDVPTCLLVIECPTFADLTETSYGPNNGADTGLYLTYSAGIYTTTDAAGLGPLFTYSSQTDCNWACPCGGIDCAVYSPSHNFYDYNNPQKSAGLGCKMWTEEELVDGKYRWSAGNPDGTAYTTFHDCCVANPDCCDVACVDCIRYPNSCDVECITPGNPVGCVDTYPCQYFDTNTTPYPNYFNAGGNVPAMVDCLLNVQTNASGDLVCDVYEDCDCACFGLIASWVGNYYFNGDPVVLNHAGDWDEVLPGSIETYNSGYTVYHEQAIAYSEACCYMCVCYEGIGMFVNGTQIGTDDCNDFEPGTGTNASGQPNCWIDCGKGTSQNGTPCSACTPSTTSTYMCDLSTPSLGCIPSTNNPNTPGSPCIYAPVGISTTWSTANNCYDTNNCNEECYYGCGCNTATTTSECISFQDVLNENNGYTQLHNTFHIDIDPSISSFYNPTQLQCESMLSAGQDCCSPIGTTYNCLVGTACTSDNSTVLGGPSQTGCVAVYPPNIGAFNFTNLTQLVAGVGNVTFADPFEACKAYCTWACQNNNGCDFEPWWNYPGPVWNNAYDCWFNSGMDCNDCGETYFCLPSQPGVSQVITASDLAALGLPGTHSDHDEALGQAAVTYTNNQQGFSSTTACQEFCRFSCNSDPSSCGCELDWGNIAASVSMDDCGNLQVALGSTYNNCCFAEWWCMPAEGCKGYMTNQLGAEGGPGAPFGHQAGPYYQLGSNPGIADPSNPATGEAGCLDYCGYVCGDGWELYLGECTCMFVHNEPDGSTYNTTPSIGAGNVIFGQTGAYQTLNDCQLAHVGTTIGNVGCCDCYNCVQATVQNGGIDFPAYNFISTVGMVTTWDDSAVGQSPADTSTTDPQPWAGDGSQIYNQGDVVVYLSGTSNCCYVYNGCCDPLIDSNACFGLGNLLCAGGVDFLPHDWAVDPHTTWTNYQDALAASPVTDPSGWAIPPVFMSAFTGLIAVNDNTALIGAPAHDIYGVPDGVIDSTFLWTVGPNWLPCNQGCPA